MLVAASGAAGIPLELALAVAMAESALNSKAERWGSMTSQAQAAIIGGDMDLLQAIIDEVWPDISFGLSQRIVEYHYLGDGSQRADNCLSVREGVFADPARDLQEMCTKLATCLATAQAANLGPVGGDPLLGACVVYNAGHYPTADDSWWSTWSANAASYRAALDRAAGMI